MSLPLLHTPADVLSRVLIGRGYLAAPAAGTTPWQAYVGGWPDGAPDRVVTLQDTAGIDQGRSQGTGETFQKYGVQVLLRSDRQDAGALKALGLRRQLAEDVGSLGYETIAIPAQTGVGAATYQLTGVSGIGQVLPLGKESPTSRRSMFSMNLLLSIRRTE